MKKLLLAAIISLTTISSVALAEIKVGIILGFTGPIETLTPAMRDSAKLAFNKKSFSFFVNCMQGYYKSKSSELPFIVSEKEGVFIRNLRWEGVFSVLSSQFSVRGN